MKRWAAIAALLLGCGASQTGTPFQRVETVDAHAWKGVMIRDAVVRGDLESAKRAAAELVALATKYEQPTPESRLEAMVQAAQRVTEAQDLHAAAQSFAFLSERCGECHARIGGPASGPALPPADALAVVPRMRRHQWGAARLWEGLVAPSSEAWMSGAAVLADAPLQTEVLPDRTAVPEITALSTTVHDLGLEATKASQATMRIAVYGKLLDTCASCHQRIGGGPR